MDQEGEGMSGFNHRYQKYLDKFFKESSKRTRIVISLSVIFLVLFLSAAALLPFKDKIFSNLFPKPESKATESTEPVLTIPKEREFASNELLVKFKPESSSDIRAKVEKHPIKELTQTGRPDLDEIARQAKVSKIEPVFKKSIVNKLKSKGLAAQGVKAEALKSADNLDRWYKITLSSDKKNITEKSPEFSGLKEALDLYRGNNQIEAVEPNFKVYATSLPNDTYIDPDRDGVWSKGAWGQSYEDMWGLKKIGMDAIWNSASIPITNITPFPSMTYCQTLQTKIQNAFLTTCANPKYEKGADLTKDKAINGADTSKFIGSIGTTNEADCQTALNDPNDPCAENPSTGQIAFWQFEENSTATGAIKDSSINGNNGTAMGTTYTSTGKYGGAWRFNGTSAYITVPDSSSLDVTSGAVTISAWINPSSLPLETSIVSKGGNLSCGNYDLYVYNGKLSLLSSRSCNWAFTSSTATVTLNTWQHVAAVTDGVNVYYYINGVFKDSKAFGGPGAADNGALEIGKEQSLAPGYFTGIIDDLRIYNRALSATEIQNLYNNVTTAPAPLYPDLISWWGFNEGSGAYGLDTSGNNRTVSLFGGSSWTSGKVGSSALNLNGSTSYADPTIIKGFGTLVNNGPYTVTLWAKTNSSATRQVILGDWDGNGNNQSFAIEFGGYGMPADHLTTLRTSDSPATNTIKYLDSNVVYQPNTWYHIAVSEASSGARTVYINGQTKASDTVSGKLKNGGKLVLGKAGSYKGIYLNGAVDEVKIYNRVLTTQEIANDYQYNSPNAPVVVADIDSGVDYNHEDLAENIWTNPGETGIDSSGKDKKSNGIDDDNNGFIDDWRGWDFSNNDNDPMDDNGHGTHTAGTIAAVGNNSKGVVGVAPQVKIMILKFLDNQGSTNDMLGAVNALTYAADMGAKISSNSWGGPKSQLIDDAVKYEYDRGMIVVAAAGNSNGDTAGYSPASVDQAITVAASDQQDIKAGFSNWGSKVDVTAPGVSILSTRSSLDTLCGPRYSVVGEKYCFLNGTSMATPHVAGAAALLKLKHPEWSNERIAFVITATADNIDDKNQAFLGLLGSGRLNIYKAVNGPYPPVTPQSVSFSVSRGESPNTSLILGNNSVSTIHWSVQSDSNWLTTDMQSGDISAGSTQRVLISIKSTDLTGGVYTGKLTFLTNNLDNSSFTVHVTLKVSEASFAEWVKQVGRGGSTTIDKAGNVYQTGTFGGVAKFGSFTLTSSNKYGDIFIIKYDKDGNVIWARQSNWSPTSGFLINASGIVTDSLGNIYLTGNFESGSIVFGTTTLSTTSNNEEIFIAKYDPSGNVVWAKQANGNTLDQVKDITIDNSDNIYITGEFLRTVSFGNISLSLTNQYYHDLFIAKYDPSGNVVWAKRSDNPNSDWIDHNAEDIISDTAGNIYITGIFGGGLKLGSTVLSAGSNNKDIFLAKYDSSGNVIWARQVIEPKDYEKANKLAKDIEGNIYLTGEYYDSANFGNVTLGNGFADLFVAKYDPSGNALWAKQVTSNCYECGYNDLSNFGIDNNGNIYFTGSFSESLRLNGTTKVLTSKGTSWGYYPWDIYLIKYDNQGQYVWVKQIGSIGNDNTLGMVINQANLYLSGNFQGTVDFDNQTLTSSTNEGGFLVKYKDPSFISSPGTSPTPIPTSSPTSTPSPIPSPTPAPTNTPTLTLSPTPQVKRVFVTSTTYDGNLGGLSGADAKCQERASTASLGGTWKAWLSDASTSASLRLTHSDTPYKLLNGTVIANNWSDLTDGSLQHAIDLSEAGTTPPNANGAWTNTSSSGNIQYSASYTCGDYTLSGDTYGVLGNIPSKNTYWTFWTTDICRSPNRLYCFEQ